MRDCVFRALYNNVQHLMTQAWAQMSLHKFTTQLDISENFEIHSLTAYLSADELLTSSWVDLDSPEKSSWSKFQAFEFFLQFSK